jgi:hypothetical protein
LVDILRVETKTGSASYVQSNIAILLTGSVAGIEDDPGQVVFLDIHLEVEITKTMVKPIDVLFELKNLAVIDTDAFKEAVAI